MSNQYIPGGRLVKVISIDDENGGNRIKVRFTPEDNSRRDSELPYAIPYLPKMLHVMPKVGEYVIAFSTNLTDSESQRFYIGPIISQYSHMLEEKNSLEALSMAKGTRVTPDVSEDLKPLTEGAFPKKEDVALLGRKNTDIILTENDARIRAGVRKVEEGNSRNVNFNGENPAYIKLKYNPVEQYADNDKYNSSIAIVADKVLLLGNNPKENDNKLITDKDDLISDEQFKKLIEKTHELPFGDTLVEFLTLFRDAFINHVHPFPTMKPCYTNSIENLQKYDLTKMLSKTIRID